MNARKDKTAVDKETTVAAKDTSPKSLKPAPGKPKKTLEKHPKSVIDFCGAKVTPLCRAFIVNYVTPGQPCFHNALQAALKAGYKESVAKTEIYGILQNPDIQKIIQKTRAWHTKPFIIRRRGRLK